VPADFALFELCAPHAAAARTASASTAVMAFLDDAWAMRDSSVEVRRSMQRGVT
jgi:hypothetical protein